MPSSCCRPGPRDRVFSPPSSDGDLRPHLKKVFWKGVRGGALLQITPHTPPPPLKSPPLLSSYCGAAALLSLSPLLARRLRYSGWAVARPEKISSTEAARAWGRTSST